jgi:uncharacterized membrane protein YhaH (DUF805 family)
MTRLHLDPFVGRAKKSSYWTAFRVMLVVFVIFVLMDKTLAAIISPYINPENKESLPVGVYLCMTARSLLGWTCFGYIWFCVWRTRAFIRGRYHIPPSYFPYK